MTLIRKQWISFGIVAGALISLLSCGDPPSISETLNAKVDYFVGDDSKVSVLIEEIGREKERIDAAFFTLENDEIANALIEAKNRGVKVRVVGDVDNASSSGFVKLLQGSVRTEFVNGELKYLPEPNLSQILRSTGGFIVRNGNLSDMSHNFVLLGNTTVWNFMAPFKSGVTPALGYRVESELLSEDFTREFKQLFSGVSSTTLDVYNGPVKSSVHRHPYQVGDHPFYYSDSLYTDQGRLRLLFSPQNGIIKTMIDEVYRATGSVYIQTESLDDPNLIKALKYKQSRGFNLLIVTSKTRQEPRTKSDLTALNALQSDADYLPTVVIIDQEKGRDGNRYPRHAIVASHEILSASPLGVIDGKPTDDDDKVELYKSDYFNDGNGWMVSEVYGQKPISIIDQLVALFKTTYKGAQ